MSKNKILTGPILISKVEIYSTKTGSLVLNVLRIKRDKPYSYEQFIYSSLEG